MRRQEKEGYKGERKREGQRYGDVRFLLLSFYFRTEYILLILINNNIRLLAFLVFGQRKRESFVIKLLYLVVVGACIVCCWGIRGRDDNRWILVVDGGGGNEGMGSH